MPKRQNSDISIGQAMLLLDLKWLADQLDTPLELQISKTDTNELSIQGLPREFIESNWKDVTWKDIQAFIRYNYLVKINRGYTPNLETLNELDDEHQKSITHSQNLFLGTATSKLLGNSSPPKLFIPHSGTDNITAEELRDIVRQELKSSTFDESNNPSQQGNLTMPKFKGLNVSQWQFLSVLATAYPDFLTKHTEQVYYIKPELNEDNTQIIGFDGFTPEFYPSHKEQLNILMSDFVKLVPRYLKKARHGNYYINADAIADDVKAYQASLEGEIEPTNQIFAKHSEAAQFQCDIFMVMPFRPHLDPVYTDHIKPVVENLDLKILRGDDPFSEHDIMHEVWSMINNARLIIADCTDKNPNVFYELGMAHTLGKPAIMITQNIDDIPFDVRGKRAIVYSKDNLNELEVQLKNAIENILG